MNFNDMNGMKGKDNTTSNRQSFNEAYQRYSGRSEEELMQELLSKAGALRASGQLDVEGLERLYATAAPLLSEVQRKRMRGIIDAIKG